MENYEYRKQIINEWIADHERHCAELGTISPRWQVARFLDMAALRLWTNSFDPYDVDCPFESPEEAEQFAIDTIKDEYSTIIAMFPLEIMYFFGYTSAKQGCFLTDYIFDRDEDYPFTDAIECYTGTFTPKMEDILVNKLGVKTLII